MVVQCKGGKMKVEMTTLDHFLDKHLSDIVELTLRKPQISSAEGNIDPRGKIVIAGSYIQTFLR